MVLWKKVCWSGDGKRNNLVGWPKGQFLGGIINGEGGGGYYPGGPT